MIATPGKGRRRTLNWFDTLRVKTLQLGPETAVSRLDLLAGILVRSAVLDEILSGAVPEIETAALLAVLATRGEQAPELAGVVGVVGVPPPVVGGVVVDEPPCAPTLAVTVD